MDDAIKQAVEQLRHEATLRTAEIERHFELKAQHFSMLEKSVDARFAEIRELVQGHSDADQLAFEAVRRELEHHLAEDIRVHGQILDMSAERMQAAKDLLSSAIEGVNRSNGEVKENLRALADLVRLNQTNSVSVETFAEFRKAVENREQAFDKFMSSSSGERAGIRNLWGVVVGAAMAGAALVTVINFIVEHTIK